MKPRFDRNGARCGVFDTHIALLDKRPKRRPFALTPYRRREAPSQRIRPRPRWRAAPPLKRLRPATAATAVHVQERPCNASSGRRRRMRVRSDGCLEATWARHWTQ